MDNLKPTKSMDDFDDRILGGQIFMDDDMHDDDIESAINVDVKEIFVSKPLVVFFDWTEPSEHQKRIDLNVTIYGNGNLKLPDFETLFDMNSFEMNDKETDWTDSRNNQELQQEAENLINEWLKQNDVISAKSYSMKTGHDIHQLMFDTVKALVNPADKEKTLAYIDFRKDGAEVVFGHKL